MPWHELHEPETGDMVTRIFDEAQQRQHVLDVRGLEEFEPAEFHVRDVAAGELDLQRTAMAAGAEQHRLLLQRHAAFAVLQHSFDDVARLVCLVANADKARALVARAIAPKILGEALPGKADDRICGGQDGLRRTVVALQRDDRGGRTELRGEIEDVAHRGGAEGVDRLRIVAHDRQAGTVRLQRHENRRLQPVGILIFVNQNVIEAATNMFR